MSALVTKEVSDSIVTITVSRPESLNALNREVLNQLSSELDSISKDVRVVVITGAGSKAFVAGADIKSMYECNQAEIKSYVELGQSVMRKIETLHCPVIAALNGYALGGGLELALACDIIVAADTAKVGQPEVNLGIIPGFGGSQRLIYRCGVGAAKRLCYTGDIISAEEAQKLGVIDKVVAAADLKAAVQAMAENISQKGPLAVSAAKRVINFGVEQMLTAGLKEEAAAFLKVFASKDRQEGMSAFLEKRKAEFGNQ
jgi:enoyl-CoA hydratase